MRDILVVEDGLHERERLLKLFASSRYSTAGAESAREAEELLNHEQFRLAVLDIGLSDKSGSYLFELMRRSGRVPYVIILTGNPSIHLKQRFIEEGAVAYIVKASPSAENEPLLELVRSLLGTPQTERIRGLPLAEFLKLYVTDSSREMFLNENGDIIPCSACGSSHFVVSFNHRAQVPPVIEGRVVCADCGKEMDPEVA